MPPRLAAYYPPDEIVTFTDIVAECDGKDCASQIEWSAKNFDDKHCDMQAHIAPGNQNISITFFSIPQCLARANSNNANFNATFGGKVRQ